MAGLDAEPLTQPYDVLHASKLFQDWLSALKERALLQTNHQSQAMLRSVLHSIRRRMTTEQVLAFADALPPAAAWDFHRGLAANRFSTHRSSYCKRLSKTCLRITSPGVDPDRRLRRVGRAFCNHGPRGS